MKDDHKLPEDRLNDFPSFRMSESTQAQMHEQILASLEGNKRQPGRNRQLMNKFRIGFLTTAALVIFSILSFNAFNPNFNSGNEEAPVTSEPEVVPEDNPEVEPTPDETDENIPFDPAVLEQKAIEILHNLVDRNMESLEAHVHPEKGLLFSPYLSISESTVHFEPNEIATLLEDETTYVWGYGEANTEILLTPGDFITEHLQAERYFDSDELFVDQENPEVEFPEYLPTVFPDAKIVEFYHAGTDQFSGLNWRSLNLVFEQDAAGEWKLVAIVNNLFTP